VNKLLRTLLVALRARRRSPLGIFDVARLPLRVRPSDLDIQRHMNNGVYLSVADFGRYDLLVRSGVWGTFQKNGWYPVVSNLTISYRKSLEPWQRYVLETRMVAADDRAIYMEQRFTVGGEIYARLYLRGRFLKRSGGIVAHSELEAATGIDLATLGGPEWLERWSTDVALPSTKQPAPSDW
jgi:acyl-CoA thioesterase FadM